MKPQGDKPQRQKEKKRLAFYASLFSLNKKGAVALIGGDKGTRIPDLLNAIQALYQLSYTPMCLQIVSQFCFVCNKNAQTFIVKKLSCCFLLQYRVI